MCASCLVVMSILFFVFFYFYGDIYILPCPFHGTCIYNVMFFLIFNVRFILIFQWAAAAATDACKIVK